MTDEIVPFHQSVPKVEEVKPKPSTFAAFFDVIKKLIDLSDDAWAAMKGILPADIASSVGPYLTGAVGFVIHLREGFEGARLALEALNDKTIQQRRTRIVSGVLTFMFAGTGAGLGAALVIGAIGIAVAGMSLLPVLVGGFLTGIYGLSLWRRSYILAQAKKVEAEELSRYQAYQETELAQDEEKLAVLTAEIKTLSPKCLSQDEEKLAVLTAEIKALGASCLPQHEDLVSLRTEVLFENEMKGEQVGQTELQKKCSEQAQLQAKIHANKKRYQDACEAKLKAERDVAFGAIEVFASALVLVGTILGGAIILGSSVATFGIAPLVFLITGVVIGFASKYFENKDEKNNFGYTHRLRAWLMDKLGCQPPVLLKREKKLNLSTPAIMRGLPATTSNPAASVSAPAVSISNAHAETQPLLSLLDDTPSETEKPDPFLHNPSLGQFYG